MSTNDKPNPFLELCGMLARESWARNEQYNKLAEAIGFSSTRDQITQALTEWLQSQEDEDKDGED